MECDTNEKKYILLFDANYEGDVLDNNTFLDTYIDIDDIKYILEIGNKIGNYIYNIKDIVFSDKYCEKINVGYKIKLNDGMGNCIGLYDSNNVYINLFPWAYFIGTKSELKFYSPSILDNKLKSVKNVKNICVKFNKNISKIEDILLEKMSSNIKNIIFDEELNDENLKYI